MMTKVLKNSVTAVVAASMLFASSSLRAGSTQLLSLEGDGFRAMVSQAGLIAGALKYQQSSVRELLAGVDVVSGNSGGTWFTTCLAYSPQFVRGLENYETFFEAEKGGYMGILGNDYQKFMNQINFEDVSIRRYIQAIKATNIPLTAFQILRLFKNHKLLNWEYALIETVFKPYDTAATIRGANFRNSLTLRTEALPVQPLVFGIAVSTNGAGIGRYNAARETIATAENVGVDSYNKPYVFTAAALTSLGRATTALVAPALPTQTDGRLDFRYSTTGLDRTSEEGPSVRVNIPELNFDGLSILTATASSSAAGGFIDSAGSLYSNKQLGRAKLPNLVVNNILNAGRELAIPVSVEPTTGTANSLQLSSGESFAEVGPVTPQELKTTPIIRLVDGGYVDNTGVTAGLGYLSANGQLVDGFNITVFTTRIPTTLPDTGLKAINPGYMKFSHGVRNLFTNSLQFQTVAGFSFSHLSNEIFDATKTTGLDAPIWSYKKPNSVFGISYYKLGVVTTKNMVNLPPGLSGTLNVWVVNTATPMVPVPGIAPWSQYQTLFQNLITGMQASDGTSTGAEHLLTTLGRRSMTSH